jgi:hypothetical protein
MHAAEGNGHNDEILRLLLLQWTAISLESTDTIITRSPPTLAAAKTGHADVLCELCFVPRPTNVKQGPKSNLGLTPTSVMTTTSMRCGLLLQDWARVDFRRLSPFVAFAYCVLLSATARCCRRWSSSQADVKATTSGFNPLRRQKVDC